MHDMVNMLNQQAAQKKQKEVAMKKDLDQQAEMWRKEREIWQEEDERLKKKIRDINKKRNSKRVFKTSKYVKENDCFYYP